MLIDQEFQARRFKQFEKIYVLYSQATNLPFMQCDEDTQEDKVFAFTREEDMQFTASLFVKQQYALTGVVIEQNRFGKLFTTLHSIGATVVELHDEGAPIRLEVDALQKESGFPEAPTEHIPAANPELELTAIYFLQELKRPVENRSDEERKKLVEMEEEMAVNLMRSNIILSFDTTDVKGDWDPQKGSEDVKVPFLKNSQGQIFQPVYTDYIEFEKSAVGSDRIMSIAAVPFGNLPDFQAKSAEGFVFNPSGFNLILNGDQIREMIERYKEN